MQDGRNLDPWMTEWSRTPLLIALGWDMSEEYNFVAANHSDLRVGCYSS